MKKITKILLIFFVVMILFSTTSVFASGMDWWGQANNFFKGAAGQNFAPLNGIITFIETLGNMIFILVTVVLGVKYIWGGVESKADVKDSLMTLVVAAIFFYGYSSIKSLFMDGNNLAFISGDYNSTFGKIYGTVMYIMNILAVAGIIYIGIRYMLAGAEGKAQLKAQGVPVILGIIMAYATITFLNLILKLFGV